MLDLKAKLLAAGLVTAESVERVEAEQTQAREAKHARAKRPGPAPRTAGGRDRPPPVVDEEQRWEKRVEKLATAGRAEQYETIRGWVDRTRVDNPRALPTEEAQRFHFPKGDGGIGWVTVEPALHAQLVAGEAGVVAFMSNNGLLHAVVPRPVALDIAKVRPEWLRALALHDFEPQAIVPAKKRKRPASDGAMGVDATATGEGVENAAEPGGTEESPTAASQPPAVVPETS